VWFIYSIKYMTDLIRVRVWPSTEEFMSSEQNFYMKCSKVGKFLTLHLMTTTNIMGIWTSAVISEADPVIMITF